MAEALGLTFDAGVMLVRRDAGGPAAKAGLEPGDIVLSLDGKPMENGRQFRINVYTRGIGEQVAIEVRRGSRSLTMRVPVAERENDTGQLEALIGAQQAIPVARRRRARSHAADRASSCRQLRRDQGSGRGAGYCRTRRTRSRASSKPAM